MKKAGLALLATAAVGAVAAAIAWSAAADSAAVIHACVAKGSDLVRIPAAGDGCGKNETAVDWNQQGPAGPQGDQGPAGAAGGSPPEPNTRVVGFLQVEDADGTIDGDATEQGHENWIIVLGFDNEAIQPTSSGTGSGGGAGKVQFKPLVITKLIDKATPKLFDALATGKTLDKVQLDLVKPDGSTFYSIKLSDAVVSDEHEFDEGKSDGHPMEQLSFTYDKIEISE